MSNYWGDNEFKDITQFFDYVIDNQTRLSHYEKEQAKYTVKHVADRMLNLSGHIPIVTNVAYAAGYCRYFARLSEAIGVRAGNKSHFGTLAGRISGKGSHIHQAMGIIISKIFTDRRYIKGIANSLSRPTNDGFGEILDEVFMDTRDELNGIIDISRNSGDRYIITILILTFFREISRLVDKVFGLDIWSLTHLHPIIEQNFYSYELNLRGTPDLILEHYDDDKNFAIVVDWKTYGNRVYKTDLAQVIAYSLIEADRMFPSLTVNQKIEAVTGTWDYTTNQIMGVSIIPIVIGAKGTVHGHPILKNDPSEESFNEFRKMVYKVKLAAQHLKLLLVNQEDWPTYVSRRDTTYEIFFGDDEGQSRKINIIRLSPYNLPSGKPYRQDSYPCVSKNGKPICNLLEACRYYFGRGYGLNDDFDRLMWKIRFMIFNNKEDELLVYRALYELFRLKNYREVVNHILGGGRIEYDASSGEIWLVDKNKFAFPHLVIKKQEKESFRARIDILDEVRTSKKGNELVGKRSLRRYETNIGYILHEGSRLLKEAELSPQDLRLLNLINEGKTCIIAPLNKYWTNPLLSPHLFTSISEVNSTNRGMNFKIEYTFSPPSRILNYAHHLFRYVTEQHRQLTETPEYDKYLVVQVNVDLTSMELSIVDLLQRRLREPTEDDEIKISEDEKDPLEELLSSSPEDEIDELRSDLLSNLREILGRGGRRR